MRIWNPRILVVGAAFSLLPGAGLTQYATRYKELPNFHKVNAEVYRGAQPGIGGLELLKRLGIKTVLNLRDDDSRAKQEDIEAQTAGLQYFNLPFARWGRPDDKEMKRVLSIVNGPVNQPVFVHCRHGADRTGVVIAVYRITHDGWTGQQATAEAKRFGLKPWQLGIKNYIHDVYERQPTPVVR